RHRSAAGLAPGDPRSVGAAPPSPLRLATAPMRASQAYPASPALPTSPTLPTWEPPAQLGACCSKSGKTPWHAETVSLILYNSKRARTEDEFLRCEPRSGGLSQFCR